LHSKEGSFALPESFKFSLEASGTVHSLDVLQVTGGTSLVDSVFFDLTFVFATFFFTGGRGLGFNAGIGTFAFVATGSVAGQGRMGRPGKDAVVLQVTSGLLCTTITGLRVFTPATDTITGTAGAAPGARTN